MRSFQYNRASDAAHAIEEASRSPTAQQGATVRFLAGGTTLVDLMKLDVETPEHVVDINGLGLDRIETHDGGLKIGALVRNSDLANNAVVLRDYPVLSQALLSGASGQLRNMATTGGNLLQRTRCMYFRDTDWPCNKRKRGSGCPAIEGENRMLGILGTSDACIATNPSDMNVALAALEASVLIQGVDGERCVSFADFFLLPGQTPHRETVLAPGDLVTHVVLPAQVAGTHSLYTKLRDRASYEFALASAAVVLVLDDRRISQVRIAMGGVGTLPWRMPEAEQRLTGRVPDASLYQEAADAGLARAQTYGKNTFKIDLAKRCLVDTLDRCVQAAQA